MNRPALHLGFSIAPGPAAGIVSATAGAAVRAAEGLWRRDASVWSSDSVVREKIANRLGWLVSPALMRASIDRLRTMADEICGSGFQDVVLLGMGGSSLAPDVLRAVVGVGRGRPRFHMLDSTDPAAVRAIATDPARTLFILASKSGTTIEPNSLAGYFRNRLEAAGVSRWASHFVAVTDAGTELAGFAVAERFRHVFINPSDIGGRYSALSFFGMVPAALMGQDVEAIIGWGEAMLDAARMPGDVVTNPAVGLGLLMAACAQDGRDKLTLVLPPSLEPFGLWVEQLVAESTGKQGVGVVPIAGETLGEAAVYGDDRVFVRLRKTDERTEAARDTAMLALAAAPVATIVLDEPTALGAEFMRWEIATAIAGSVLGVNPFDEPNVQQAKDATRVLLERYESQGQLRDTPADQTSESGVTLTLTAAARVSLGDAAADSLLTCVGDDDYVALLAFLGPDPRLADVMRTFRMTVRDRLKVATMFGYGPRYLHSTGQLHKGGPNSGVFVLVTATPAEDIDIPGRSFSFGTLELAQGLGDFASLEATGRRAVHIHLPAPDPRLLDAVLASLTEALAH
jgi:glucose-6-phosphate isomerase